MDFLGGFRNVLYGGSYIDLFVCQSSSNIVLSLYLYVNHTSILKKSICTLDYSSIIYNSQKGWK